MLKRKHSDKNEEQVSTDDKDNLADTDYCHNYTHANPWKNDIKFKNPLYPPVYEVHKGGSEDKDVDFHVRCLACDRGVRHLDAGDNPWVSHRRCFPACPFARRTNGDQFIELIQASVDQGEAISELDVTIPELAEYRRKCTEDLEFSAQEFEGAFHQFGKVLPTLEDFISCIVDNQKRNEIEGESITVDTRETTYRRPENASCEARLADAGFHFTGVGDLVRCFACDGGLRQWDAGEDPWIEHCRSFPACPFARKTKGHEFIELIQASVDQGEAISELDVTIPELAEYRRICTEDLEFPVEVFERAYHQFKKNGNILPTLEDLIFCILDNQKRDGIENLQGKSIIVGTLESIHGENACLEHISKCQWCKVNNVNALFLPCTHHRICMDCVRKYDVTMCPFCDRHISKVVTTLTVTYILK
ncbi:baculoviral IAP repeat-containing protein 7-B-like isoform X2 [Mya arenaria]|uniref:baculoviral IAP repeat-containing protein 7-B-like isoform X2 n=1 Tax=Mya arenaria TaxID=6604 RepID=UPI0022DFF2AB|nr:baculoviral IAP repeat-containing protein 7-B-like isoform X2 [Mya arenaria]